MIEIEVRYFGPTRQLAGTAHELVSLGEDARLADLINALDGTHGAGFGQQLAHVDGLRILVNGREYVQAGGLDAPLADGWAVVFMPQIFGG